MIVCKVLNLWLLISIIKWSNCISFMRPTQSSIFDETHNTELNNTIENNFKTFTDKHSLTTMSAATYKINTAVSSIELDTNTNYTYLNIGVLMASHLGYKL